MKITMGKDYKKWMTLEEYEQAKGIISGEKENPLTPAYYAEMAAREILAAKKANGVTDWFREVLVASAEISGNCRVRDYYGDNTGKLDIWISAKVTTGYGYLELGAYVTDIQSISCASHGEMACHMYQRYARFEDR